MSLQTSTECISVHDLVLNPSGNYDCPSHLNRGPLQGPLRCTVIINIHCKVKGLVLATPTVNILLLSLSLTLSVYSNGFLAFAPVLLRGCSTAALPAAAAVSASSDMKGAAGQTQQRAALAVAGPVCASRHRCPGHEALVFAPNCLETCSKQRSTVVERQCTCIEQLQ